MKTTPFKSSSFHARLRFRQPAFTLPEVLIASTIMIMVLAGVLACQAFGMRLFQLSKAKLGASDDARKAINLLSTEIRAAKTIKIGNSNLGLSDFTECAPGQLQVGSAVQIYGTTNTNSFVLYYRNSNSNQLQRTDSATKTPTVVASYITNSTPFACEDAFGNTLTNSQNNRVIAFKLQFYQLQYPTVNIGGGSYFDYYQISTKTTPRVF